MSPLARPLLALAALTLLASADADRCTVVMEGHKTNTPYVFPTDHADPPSKNYNIQNACSPGEVFGEQIVACSLSDNCKPSIVIADGTYTPFTVYCDCPGGCSVDITQYC